MAMSSVRGAFVRERLDRGDGPLEQDLDAPGSAIAFDDKRAEGSGPAFLGELNLHGNIGVVDCQERPGGELVGDLDGLVRQPAHSHGLRRSR